MHKTNSQTKNEINFYSPHLNFIRHKENKNNKKMLQIQ